MSSSSANETREINRELAVSNVNRAASLVGTSLAIFTFVLFFLYPRYITSQIDSTLFQIVLTDILLTIFMFGFSGLYYYTVISSPTLGRNSIKEQNNLLHRAEVFFILGLLLGVLEPALILFTVGLTVPAVIASLLWIIFILAMSRQRGNRETIGQKET